MDNFDAELLRAELETKLYVPGAWVCPKCGFHQQLNYVQSGNVGANLAVFDEPCPNDGSKMERLTWEAHATGLAKVCEQQITRAAEAEDLLRHAWLHDSYRDLGFKQMTTLQKGILIRLLEEGDFKEAAERLRNFMT